MLFLGRAGAAGEASEHRGVTCPGPCRWFGGPRLAAGSLTVAAGGLSLGALSRGKSDIGQSVLLIRSIKLES